MIKRTAKIVLFLLLAYLLYVILTCALVPLARRDVAPEEQARIDTALSAPGGAGERVLCIDDNTDALLWRLRAIEAAREEIVLSTFDFDADQGGQDILAALLHAADRGVRVKLIVDGVSGVLDVRRAPEFAALAASPRAEIKIYEPISLLKPWMANYRLHDKYLIVDDWLYLLGGRNTGNLFLGDYQRAQNNDRDILVYTAQPGPSQSLQQVRDYFAQIWSLENSRPFTVPAQSDRAQQAAEELRERYLWLQERYPQAFGPVDWAGQTLPAARVALLSNPVNAGNKAPTLWYALYRLMEQGQDILIQTPYVVCGKQMYQDLERLTAGGRQIYLLTNGVENGANPFGCSDYLNQKEKILSCVQGVYEYVGAQSLHTKTILIDDRLSVVGSYNLDMRSTYLDTETMLVIDCPELNAALRAKAEEDMASSKLVRADASELPGPAYRLSPLPWSKRAAYTLLRFLAYPVRYLL